MQEILTQLAPKLRSMLEAINFWQTIEEIRLRVNKPVVIKAGGQEFGLNTHGKCHITRSYRVTTDDLTRTMQIMTKNSWYALEDEIKAGYLSLSGGHRVGISGKITLDNGVIKNLRYINGLSIRFAKEIIGAANDIVSRMYNRDRVLSTLIISPPGCGKTTLLRDICRQLSNRGLDTVVIDERSEIAACYQGVPQLDVGLRTDVIDGCPKVEGIIMAIRGMSPRIIITDEIGNPDDGLALTEAIRAGVSVISTCHGVTVEQVKNRLWVQKGGWVFEQAVILSRRCGPGTIERVLKWD